MYIRKMVRKIKNIIVGWYRKLTGRKSNFAENRIKICKRCSHREEFAGMEFCSLCFCEIYAKSEVEDEICLDGRWPNVND